MFKPHHTYEVETGRVYLFGDMYIKNGEIHLISTYYQSHPFNFKSDVVITCNDTPCSFLREVGHNEYEPLRMIAFSGINAAVAQKCATNVVTVQYRNLAKKTYHIENNQEQEEKKGQSKLSMATLFKYDYEYVELAYRFYKAQGVDRFILFYNGTIDSELWNNLPHYSDIFYAEWNLPYWHDSRVDCHHAQTMFLSELRDRYMDQCDFLIVNDLDEFICVRSKPETTLLSFLASSANKVPYLIVPNCFSHVYYCDECISFHPNRTHLGFGWAKRNKTIYNSKLYSGHFGVHLPKQSPEKWNVGFKHDLIMYHAVNVGHTDRNDWVTDVDETHQPVLSLAVL